MERKDALAELEAYVQGAASASNRARTILLIIVMSSILGVSIIRLTTWIDARIAIAQNALSLKACDPQRQAPLDPGMAALFWRARTFCRALEIPEDGNGQQELTARIEAYRKLRYDRAFFFAIPAFGSNFDHNDAGVIAGLSFLSLMAFSWYSLGRERRNLELAFAKAQTLGMLDECHDRLALSQVFTVAPDRRNVLPRWLPKLPFLFPAMTLGYLFWDHWSTYALGYAIEPFQNRLVFGVTFVASGLTLWLGVACIGIAAQVDHEWDSHGKNAAHRQ